MDGMEQEHSQERLHTLKVRQWVRISILGCIILLCGAAIGSATTYWWFMRFQDSMPPPPPGDMPRMITERLSRDLGLTDEQRGKILAIFENSHVRIEALRAQVQPDIDQEMDSVREQVDAVLTAEQQDAWRRKFDEMHERMHPGPGGPPGGPMPGFGHGPGPEPGGHHE